MRVNSINDNQSFGIAFTAKAICRFAAMLYDICLARTATGKPISEKIKNRYLHQNGSGKSSKP